MTLEPNQRPLQQIFALWVLISTMSSLGLDLHEVISGFSYLSSGSLGSGAVAMVFTSSTAELKFSMFSEE